MEYHFNNGRTVVHRKLRRTLKVIRSGDGQVHVLTKIFLNIIPTALVKQHSCTSVDSNSWLNDSLC